MNRPNAHKRGYDHRWRKIRVAFLAGHPLCTMCSALGKVVPATVVDHIKPHRRDPRLFYNIENLQALCSPCHDQHKQREEKGGGIMGCDAEGVPIDPRHHWR